MFLLCLSLVYVAWAAERKCSDLHHLPVTVDQRMEGDAAVTVVTDGVLSCARQCLSISACLSFNYDLHNGDCEIITASSGSMLSSPGFVFSVAEHWTRFFTECVNHTCGPNKRCIQTVGGSGQCVLTHCPHHPNISNGIISAIPGDPIPIGISLNITCDPGYVPCGKAICMPDGTWTNMTCASVTSCAGVQRLSSSYTDGEYWLYISAVNYARVKVYCHNMHARPSAFISLPAPYFMEAPTVTSDGCIGERDYHNDTLGNHTYYKIGVEEENLEIIQDERTFYNKTGESTADVGEVRDCYSPVGSSCGPAGHMVMDLKGTGLALRVTVTWKEGPGESVWPPNVTATPSRQLFHVSCGGMCGGCVSATRMLLKPRVQDVVPDDAAIEPVCDSG